MAAPLKDSPEKTTPVEKYGIDLLRVAGIYVGSVAMFESLVRALETSRIEPIIDQTFGFAEARKAYERLASGEHFGKVVIAIP